MIAPSITMAISPVESNSRFGGRGAWSPRPRMRSKLNRTFHNFLADESGTTLAENMIAMLVMTVVLLGGMQFFIGGRARLDSTAMHRLAVLAAEQRLETARRFSYAQLADSLNETDTPIFLNSRNATRTTIVTNIDDAFDGSGGGDKDANPLDYKMVTTTINWIGAPPEGVSLTLFLDEDYPQ